MRIKNEYPELKATYLGLELMNLPLNEAKTEALASVRTRWLGVVDSVRTIFERKNDATIYIPALEYVEK